MSNRMSLCCSADSRAISKKVLRVTVLVGSLILVASSPHLPLVECRSQLERLEVPVIAALSGTSNAKEPSCENTKDWRQVVNGFDQNFEKQLSSSCLQYVNGRSATVLNEDRLADLVEVSGARTRVGVDVATAKFLADPDLYRHLVEKNDSEGIMRSLTNVEVEAEVVNRVTSKAVDFELSTMRSDSVSAESGSSSFATAAAGFFLEILIPLTKSLEVSVIQNLATVSTRENSAHTTPADIIQREIGANDVVVFSKSYCPFCRRTKALFNSVGVPFTAIELDERNDGGELQAALLALTGQRTVPNVFVKEKHIGGNDDVHRAHADGSLVKMLS
mmetsp:Transcript_78747/g.157421  ORF Transcript_78747/g.157421 Transcript_78747/m.157421 type:complete len:333 (+) Transcript_78747:29-1027(+)